MSVHIVTGKLGSGKTLVAVGKIQDYLNQDRIVATNLNLYLENLINPFAKKSQCYRLPDKPTVDDLQMLPKPFGDDESFYDENKTGLLVLDECATWFNSRSWNDKGRKDVIDWFIHARKYGWDIIFILQNVLMMDAQARDGLAEHVVHCKRLDRFSIPFLTPFLRMGGFNVRPPQIHIGIVKYGAAEASPLIERWVYTGRSLYSSYQTRQVFSSDNNALSMMLPPYYFYGANTNAKDHAKRGFINSTNRIIKSVNARATFLIGLLIGGLTLNFYSFATDENQVVATTQQAPNATKEKRPADPLTGVFITGSVKSTKGFDYIFETQNGAFYPENIGYTVRYISNCRASLLLDNKQTIITCSPHAQANDAAQPREGAAAQVSEQAANTYSSSSTDQQTSS